MSHNILDEHQDVPKMESISIKELNGLQSRLSLQEKALNALCVTAPQS